jgi:Fe-S-cluster-containing hydrogenase component 2
MSIGPSYIDDAWEALASDAVVVHPERCTKVRNRNTKCLKCADACTSGCISFEEGELVLDLSRCVGCGTCATVCPTCALEAHNPSDVELKASCKRVLECERSAGVEHPEVAVVCSQVKAALAGLLDEERVVEVVCVGRMDESLLCELGAAGVEVVCLYAGACELCAQRHGLATAQKVIESTEALYEAWGLHARVAVSEGLPFDLLNQGVDHAEAQQVYGAFFAHGCACTPVNEREESAKAEGEEASSSETQEGIKQESGASSERADETHGTGMRFYWESTHSRQVHKNLHVMKDGTLPHFVPERRNRVLEALTQLGSPQTHSVSTRLMGTVAIDVEVCSSCRMCAVFCPTGAIRKFDDADGTIGVLHTPADCIKCESCYDICPARAITIQDGVSAEAIIEGREHRFTMKGREISLRNNPHQMLETMKKNIPGDIFER